MLQRGKWLEHWAERLSGDRSNGLLTFFDRPAIDRILGPDTISGIGIARRDVCDSTARQ